MTTDRATLARGRLAAVVEYFLPGPEAAKDRAILLGHADEYAAAMAEQAARPPEHYWGPERGEDGSGAA